MLALTLILADIQIHAERDEETALWNCTLADGMGGSQDKISFTDEQMGAILALGVGGDGQVYSAMMYAIAEPAIEMLAPELRPIP